MGISLVVRDTEQPGAEPRRVVELANVLIGLQKHVLAQIQRVVRVAGETKKVIEDTLLPTGYEKVKRLDIALSNT